jgi:hemerythrin superfamily protein
MTETRIGDIVDMLTQDHQEAKQLLIRVTSALPDAREDLFWSLVAELVRHEVAEEVVVYPTIRNDTRDSDVEVDARLAEQAEAEEMLAEMEKLDRASAEFGQHLEKLWGAVLDHAEAEERTIFPLLRAIEPDEARVQLGARYQQAKAAAPSHPHPHSPDTPPGNKVLGPIAAFVDHVRDALKGL